MATQPLTRELAEDRIDALLYEHGQADDEWTQTHDDLSSVAWRLIEGVIRSGDEAVLDPLVAEVRHRFREVIIELATQSPSGRRTPVAA